MTIRQIDTSQMPTQFWTIKAGVPHNPRIVSAALTNIPEIPKQSPASFERYDIRVDPAASLGEEAFENAAKLKILISQVAMHIKPKWREVIFRQIDFLLDPSNWEEDSSFIQMAAFKTFLRFVMFAEPTRLPSLGVGPTGNVLAAWFNEDKRIAVEFLPDDKAAVAFSRTGSREGEVVSWRGHVAELQSFAKENRMGSALNDESA